MYNVKKTFKSVIEICKRYQMTFVLHWTKTVFLYYIFRVNPASEPGKRPKLYNYLSSKFVNCWWPVIAHLFCRAISFLIIMECATISLTSYPKLTVIPYLSSVRIYKNSHCIYMDNWWRFFYKMILQYKA